MSCIKPSSTEHRISNLGQLGAILRPAHATKHCRTLGALRQPLESLGISGIAVARKRGSA